MPQAGITVECWFFKGIPTLVYIHVSKQKEERLLFSHQAGDKILLTEGHSGVPRRWEQS